MKQFIKKEFWQYFLFAVMLRFFPKHSTFKNNVTSKPPKRNVELTISHGLLAGHVQLLQPLVTVRTLRKTHVYILSYKSASVIFN